MKVWTEGHKVRREKACCSGSCLWNASFAGRGL